MAAKVLSTTDPKTIKHLGRQVKPFVEAVWLSNRERIVQEASYFKFKNTTINHVQSSETGKKTDLRKALLETGDRELIEASPFDKIWGIGFSKDKVPVNRRMWGMNLLGKALMNARTKLRAEEVEAKKMEEEVDKSEK